MLKSRYNERDAACLTLEPAVGADAYVLYHTADRRFVALDDDGGLRAYSTDAARALAAFAGALFCLRPLLFWQFWMSISFFGRSSSAAELRTTRARAFPEIIFGIFSPC